MAILAECPFCHRRQTVKNKKCLSQNGNGCGADLEKAKRAGKLHYWIAYRLPGGKQKFEKLTGEHSTSIEYARDADAKRKVQNRENRIFDIKPVAKMTFLELTDWYLDLEKVKSMAYFPTLKIYLKKFNSEFGNKIVNQIRVTELENLQAKRKAEGKADSTVDQEIAAARVVIKAGFDNDLVGGDTLRVFRKVKRLLKRNSNARDNIVTLEQFRALLNAAPSHLLAILATGFFTGMRRGEILSLTWPKVDLKNRFIRLEAADTKDRQPRIVPICNELYDILKTIPKALHDEHVFLYNGKPVRDIRTGLKKACKDSGISYGRDQRNGFVFQDLRRCFNIYMRKTGIAEPAIMGMTRHSTREKFEEYNKIDEEDIKHAVNLMKGFLSSFD
jgi:integrase